MAKKVNSSTLTGRSSNHYHQVESKVGPKPRRPRRVKHIATTNAFTTSIEDLFQQCRECGAPTVVTGNEGRPCPRCNRPLQSPSLLSVTAEWQSVNGLKDAEMVALLKRTGYIDQILKEQVDGGS